MNRNFRKTALLVSTMALLGLGYSTNANAAEAPQEVQQAAKKITGTVVDASGPRRWRSLSIQVPSWPWHSPEALSF